MKTTSLSSIAAGVMPLLGFPVFALEAPADNAPPPPPVAKQKKAALPEIKLGRALAKPVAEVPFLGVTHGPVPELLAGHLDLKSGEGAVVLSILPDSPAAQAGIAVDDVITHVAGQPVDAQAGLAQRISDHRPTAGVNFVVIRKGKPISIDVTLGARPQQLAACKPRQLDPLDLEGLPGNLAEKIRAAIGENVRGMELELRADPGQMKQLQRMLKQPQQLDPQLLGIMGGRGIGADLTTGKSSVAIQDDKGSVERKCSDGFTEITVKDANKETIWKGPWNTAEDKAAVPADISERIEGCGMDRMVPEKNKLLLLESLNLTEGEE